LLVAVSGGPDSLCLLHVLWRLGMPVGVAHFDHQLRPESAGEAEFVGSFAAQLGLPFVLGREDVRAFAERQAMSIEDSARTLRYRFLFRQAEILGYQAIAVAHTADDQVETVLMHFLRGTGLAGLCGMTWCGHPQQWGSDMALIRPLLGVWRWQVEDYLAENQINPLLDPTNQDVEFTRNYIRHRTLPALEQNHPRLRERIWQMAEILSGEYEIIEDTVESIAQDSLSLKGDGYVAFGLQGFRSQPIGIQRGLIRWAIHQIRQSLQDIDFSLVERAISFIHTPPRTRRSDLGAGLQIFLEGQSLWMATWEAELPRESLPGQVWPALQSGETKKLEVPGLVQLRDGWTIEAKMADQQTLLSQARENEDGYTAWLDAATLKFPLIIRARQAGERIRPLGLQGHSIKVSDLMINSRLSRRARRDWPLVLSGDEVAWIPGLRLAHPFRVSEETQTGIKLVLSRQES
jgi:tRNA(Ile)-lysidine synthase